MSVDPESVDLAALAGKLEEAVPARLRAGYVVGKTALRDETVRALGCSQTKAENLVDTMVARGFLRFSGDPAAAGGAGTWYATTPP